ncbi:hypothetical protein QUA80_31330, partial [Microcoleus sp. F4-D5]
LTLVSGDSLLPPQSDYVPVWGAECGHKGLGNKAFKPQKVLIPTYFEAVMVVIARRLEQGKINNLEQLGERYKLLIEDENFSGVAQKIRNLTSADNVRHRLKFASNYLGNLE